MPALWIGFATFFVVSLALGVRLLALAWRTQQAPEFLIGLAVLGIGPLGFGLQALTALPQASSFAEALAATGAAAVAIGVWAQLAFNWIVYRRGSSAALAATLALSIAMAAHLLIQPLLGSFLDAARGVRLNAARGTLQALALGWGAAEAFVYGATLRRRARLGLANTPLVHRFLWWGAAAGAAALGAVIGVAASLATGKSPLELPAVLASSSALGLVAALGTWLAFAPPSAYVAWLAGARRAT